MMSSDMDYIISFEKLKVGSHLFKFEITTSFFEKLTYSIIQGGDIKVDFFLEKKETMMIGRFEMAGTVQRSCDRCNESVDVFLQVSQQVIFKFGNEISDDENLIMIPHSDFTIDVSLIIYELLTVALPARSIHEEGACNEEMLDLLDDYVGFDDDLGESEENEDDNIDPRWLALKKLK